MKFIKQHKKAFIISSVIILILIVLIILMFTLFSLKKVELKFKTSTINLSQEVQEQIEQETLKNSGSVLFIGKERIINDLEKKFPYLKIINIETKIPNKFVIHCAEREEFYAINSDSKVYYLDEEFKILRISDEEFQKTQNGAVLLNFQDIKMDDSVNPPSYNVINLDLNLENSETGQFVNLGSQSETSSYFANKLQKISTSLLESFELNNRDISTVKALYNEFEIFYKAEAISETSFAWRICLRLIDNTNYEIQIIDADNNLFEKINVMFVALSTAGTESPADLINSKLIIYQNLNGQFVYNFVEK